MDEKRKAELRGLCEMASKSTFDLFGREHYIVNKRYLAALPEALDEIDRLTVELAAVTRERDAAVSDLKRASICDQCTHWPTMNLATFTCEIAGKKPFSACKHYEWHGVQAPDRAEGEKHG